MEYVFFLGCSCGVEAQNTIKSDKTDSPYFYIENGDESIDGLPLKKTNAEVAISGVIADVVITQTYVNEGSRPINATYIFPGSTRAAVNGMTMKIGEQIIKANIKEREKAKKTFETAKKKGKQASLLQQHRPNVFSMNVANIMPGDTIDIKLQYTEILVPTEGTYEFVYPSVVGPRYSNQTQSATSDTDQWIKNPFLQEGVKSKTVFDIATAISTGIPLQELTCPTHKVNIGYEDKTFAMVVLDPSEKYSGNRDYILRYRLQGKKIESGLMLYEGNDENFFLLLSQPPERLLPKDIPPREYIFVVDISGSMNGFPLNTSKELLKDLIGRLRPIDKFNVILFAGGSRRMSPLSVPAGQENIDKAIQLIERQHGSGGTELYPAMKKALNLPGEENTSRSIIVITDGFISAESKVFELINNNVGKANVFAFGIGSSVNRFLIEGIAKAGYGEPFVVTEPGKAAEIATTFRKYIQSPVLTNINA